MEKNECEDFMFATSFKDPNQLTLNFFDSDIYMPMEQLPKYDTIDDIQNMYDQNIPPQPNIGTIVRYHSEDPAFINGKNGGNQEASAIVTGHNENGNPNLAVFTNSLDSNMWVKNITRGCSNPNEPLPFEFWTY